MSEVEEIIDELGHLIEVDDPDHRVELARRIAERVRRLEVVA